MINNSFITTKITQLLNNGFAFKDHLSVKEKKEIESKLIDYYDHKFYGAFMEDEMIYVIDSDHNSILMMEVTRNSIYFNPYEHPALFDVIYLTLEFVTNNFAETVDEPDPIEDETTQDMPVRPKPNFDIL
tara:strand:+ start:242 stop:631 length:390 start_codon:yes stop_codon:yes gene_type:complete